MAQAGPALPWGRLVTTLSRPPTAPSLEPSDSPAAWSALPGPQASFGETLDGLGMFMTRQLWGAALCLGSDSV